ncbi:NEDD8-activating enzyme E1 regulatory subunit [Clydaea vesicula]|uniref:NEDD8-activating enzyme E1 regulatory subunit n=1 Tax=Clydaea vesicula TaxID=447962 RepID=A0AAD5U696_9FUNG|nr:NEDD8-activating enzyme E1 regulatory subunit [Clydaea vesicula]
MQQPNTKTQRYDRQLRLWHNHGQQALENSKVLLINGSATGTEILKNLVLPGIQSFTVLDGNKVANADLGNNFFLTRESVGKSRSKEVTDLLRELNNDVEGNHLEEDPTNLINNDLNFFKKFTIVVASQLIEVELLKLSAFLWENNIPLIVVRTYGFIGYLRIAVPEHTVVETHPEQIVDLRLDSPFKELSTFANSFDFSTMTSFELSHVPYVVLLLRSLGEFRQQYGHLPSSTNEKNEFKNLIKQKMSGVTSETENFDEALSSAFRTYSPTSNTQSILQDEKISNLNLKSTNFWILAKALKSFIENEGNGFLPVAGTLPDMKSDTTSYVELQTIYKNKAKQDVASVNNYLLEILNNLGKPKDSIPLEEVERFCKNANFLRVIKYRSLNDEYLNASTTLGFTTNDILHLTVLKKKKFFYKGKLLEDLNSNVVFFVLIRAVDSFWEKYRRYPGVHNSEVDADIPLLKRCTQNLLQGWGVNPGLIQDDHIHCMVRAGACEMHNMAAIQGGIVAQEIIKILTGQYIPLDNSFIFNGMNSTSTTFRI